MSSQPQHNQTCNCTPYVGGRAVLLAAGTSLSSAEKGIVHEVRVELHVSQARAARSRRTVCVLGSSSASSGVRLTYILGSQIKIRNQEREVTPTRFGCVGKVSNSIIGRVHGK